MTTRKITLILVALMAITLTTSCEKQEARTIDQLPQQAKTFINTNFPGDPVTYILFNRDLLEKEYDVHLASGVELEFTYEGNWKEVDCHNNAVPAAIIPSAISDYVASYYPTFFITQITKTVMHGIIVELSNDFELVFDKNGNYIRIDD